MWCLRALVSTALAHVAVASMLRLHAPAQTQSPVVVRSLIGHGANSTSNMTHRPFPADNLAEWKTGATDCLTWCGSMKENCFRGCLNDCISVLKAPPCTSFVLGDKKCGEKCKDLEKSWQCLKTVKAGSTQECHSKLHVELPKDNKCKYR